MQTIKKRADQLQPGDLIIAVCGHAAVPSFVEATARTTHLPNTIVQFRGGAVTTWSDDTEVDVIEGLLTPAQQHADELLKIARTLRDAGYLDADEMRAMNAMLDKIDPPQAPSYAEVLAALIALRGQVETVSDDSRQADRVLAQVKRAGVLE